MDSSEENFEKIDKKLEELNKKITILQDLILYMKTEFDIINKSKSEKECLSQLIIIADQNMNLFLDERDTNCKLLDICTTVIEKGIFEVLHTFTEKGHKSALNIILDYKKFSEEYINTKKCPNIKCMNKAIKIFQTLWNLITISKEESKNNVKNIFSMNKELNNREGSEKEEYNLLNPLSNENRLKILKKLSKGGTYYTQLERQIGIKGGHFHFHLNKLVKSGYVIQEENKGKYLITINGLKALKFLFELREGMIQPSLISIN